MQLKQQFLKMNIINYIVLVYLFHVLPTLARLMGPFKCPDGSVCTTKQNCQPQLYRMTPDGKPFFCGPPNSVGKNICCLRRSKLRSSNHLHQTILKNQPHNKYTERNNLHRPLNIVDDMDDFSTLSKKFQGERIVEDFEHDIDNQISYGTSPERNIIIDNVSESNLKSKLEKRSVLMESDSNAYDNAGTINSNSEITRNNNNCSCENEEKIVYVPVFIQSLAKQNVHLKQEQLRSIYENVYSNNAPKDNSQFIGTENGEIHVGINHKTEIDYDDSESTVTVVDSSEEIV